MSRVDFAVTAGLSVETVESINSGGAVLQSEGDIKAASIASTIWGGHHCRGGGKASDPNSRGRKRLDRQSGGLFRAVDREPAARCVARVRATG